MSLCAACGSDAGDIAKFCPSCGATVHRGSNTGDPLIGRIVANKFRVESLLGEGGMGMVYKATQVNLDKTIVLKVLRPALASDERTVQRFQREARAASRLNHPNSIGIIDFGESKPDGSMYIAMEYCPGHDLHHILSHAWPLEEPRIIRVMSQVLSALAEAHAHGVIHRDLKPENIMVESRRGESDFVKVLDFGIAKITDTTGEEGQALTRAGFVCGTPEYMSPEQARGAQIDHRSDLYAVGVILYQLVTGLLPFDSESAVGFATAHLTQEVPLIRKRRPEARCSPPLERLIMRALSKDPNQRPQTADIFREELLALAPGADDSTQTAAFPPEQTATGVGGPQWNDRTPAESKWSDRTPADPGATVVRREPPPRSADEGKMSSRGRMPAARNNNATTLDPPPANSATGTNTSPVTRPDASGFGGGAKLAVALAGLGLLGASGFFAYEFFFKRPPADVAATTGSAVDPPAVTQVTPPPEKKPDVVPQKPPEKPPEKPATTGGGTEIKLVQVSAADSAKAQNFLRKARSELLSNPSAALADAQQAYDLDSQNLANLRFYLQAAVFAASSDPTKRQLAAELSHRLEDRSTSEMDKRLVRDSLKKLGM